VSTHAEHLRAPSSCPLPPRDPVPCLASGTKPRFVLPWIGLSVCPAAETRFPTDTSMVLHENQTNKSSTSVGIGME
jgi:hypothetical protein